MKESRISAMSDYITKHTNVTLQTLADEFGVSIYTARRDINELADRGIVEKKYGGVSINRDESQLIDFMDRNTVFREEKREISRKAASLVEDGDIIFIDGGTTTLFMPEYLRDKDITVVTNNALIIVKMLRFKHMKLIILGGELDRRANSISGLSTHKNLENINITKAFISTTGVSKNFMVTNFTAVDAELKRLCIEKSNASYLLADHSKFGVSSLVSYASLNQFDGVITSKELSIEYQEYLKQHHVECLCE